jgi:hypothetical protein
MSTLRWDRQGLEEAGRALKAWLVALTALTALDIELGVFCHGGPVESRVEVLIRLFKTEMTCYGRIMSIVKKRET